VKEVTESSGKYLVTLSETAFYPGGGGQPSDRGTIDGIPVEDVYEQDGKVNHVLGKAPQSKVVTCVLDVARRFDMMQQHTGQHLLSAVLLKLYGCKTSSLHMGEKELSIDVEMPEMSPQILTDVEDEVNDHIYKDLPVATYTVTHEDVSKLTLRKTPPKEGDARIVEIESIDRSPCCGTHVRRTGELGIIKIVKTEKRGGETRVYFKCGKRALKDYQLKQDIVSGLVRLYRMSETEVLEKTEATAVQLKNTQKELSELKDKMLKVEARDIVDASSSGIIEKIYSDKSFADISTLTKHIIEMGVKVAIIGSGPEKRLLFACGQGIVLNCGKVLKEHLADFNGKGGGKDNWANAGFNSIEDMEKFASFLIEFASKNDAAQDL
jgi:alanyl-tRNA synthetase